jgi:vacuolar-type H+-ATPase subunit I/STV1
LVVLGGVVGLFTGLEATQSLFLGALHVSIGAVAAFVANVAFGAFGAWGLRTRDAALAPGAGWFLAVLGLLFLPHPGGDIVVPGSGGDAVAFLLAGIAGIVAAGLLGARIVPREASLRPPLHR